MLILNYDFEFIDNIIPLLDENGEIIEFSPQNRYDNKNKIKLHEYGNRSFCRFSIHSKWSKVPGVYAFFINGELAYIGQCCDFAKRINQGYGNISPRNCYIGGQSTNCKINKLILNSYSLGNKVTLYFYKTNDYINVESLMIKELNPPYNSTYSHNKKQKSPFSKNKKHVTNEIKKEKIECKKSTKQHISVTEIEEYINKILKEAEKRGEVNIILTSGNIHKELGLKNRMPMVCNAMYSVMRKRDSIVSSTPSGYSSTIQIKYTL